MPSRGSGRPGRRTGRAPAATGSNRSAIRRSIRSGQRISVPDGPCKATRPAPTDTRTAARNPTPAPARRPPSEYERTAAGRDRPDASAAGASGAEGISINTSLHSPCRETISTVMRSLNSRNASSMSNNGDALTTTRRVFLPDRRQQRDDVRRTLLEPEHFPVPFAAPRRIRIHQIGRPGKRLYEMFGGVVHHLYVRNPQQRKIHGGDPGRNRIAFDGDHPVETFRKMGRIDARPQVRSMQSAPPYRFSAATASLLACSNASGGKIQRAR